MKQIFEVSSLFQLACVHAAIRSGVIDQAAGTRPHGTERILLVSDNRGVNDFGPSFVDEPFAAQLLEEFDRVVDYADLVWPSHPTQWKPAANDAAMLERLFRAEWALADDDLQLFVESVQAPPATSLATVFSGAQVFVHADGLMSYGPLRSQLGWSLAQRLGGLIMVDLVSGLRPLLLREYGVPVFAVEPAALRQTMELMAGLDVRRALAAARRSAATLDVDTAQAADTAHVADTAGRATTAAEAAPPPVDTRTHAAGPGSRTALVVGQYLGDIGLIDQAQETELFRSMLVSARENGAGVVYVKPHPASPVASTAFLKTAGRQLGLTVVELPGRIPAELCIHVLRPDVVLGCFSTALATADRLYGATAVAIGTEDALEFVRPFENSNRIPVTICRYLYGKPATGAPGAPSSADDTAVSGVPAHGSRVSGLQELVDTVGYCMQSRALPELRDTARAFLERNYVGHTEYFKRKRLTILNLPGKLPAPQRPPRSLPAVARRIVRGLRRTAQVAPAKIQPAVRGASATRAGASAARAGASTARAGAGAGTSTARAGAAGAGASTAGTGPAPARPGPVPALKPGRL